jgi:hypothetical protein
MNGLVTIASTGNDDASPWPLTTTIGIGRRRRIGAQALDQLAPAHHGQRHVSHHNSALQAASCVRAIAPSLASKTS